jgi:hypothetical protein
VLLLVACVLLSSPIEQKTLRCDELHGLGVLFLVRIEEDVVRNDAWFLLHFMLSTGEVYVNREWIFRKGVP